MTTENSSLAGMPLKSKGRKAAFYPEFCNQTPKPGSLVWMLRSKARQMADPLCALLFIVLISTLPKSDFAREEDAVFCLKNDKIEILVPLGDWGGAFWLLSTVLSSPLKQETRVTVNKAHICSNFPALFSFTMTASCSHLLWSISFCTENL